MAQGNNANGKSHSTVSRRRYLVTAGSVSFAGLAGCTGSNSNGSGGSGGGGGSNGSGGGNGNNSNQSKKKSAGDINLVASSFIPESSSLWQQTGVKYFDAIEQKTNGGVTIERFTGGELGGGTASLRLMKSDSADITYVPPSYYSDQLGLATVMMIPGSFETAEKGVQIMIEMARPGGILFEEVYKPNNLMPLQFYVLPPYQVATRQNPMKTLGDWNGKQIRSGGSIMTLTIEALGGSPADIGISDLYSSLDQGTIDGAVYYIAGMKNYSIPEVVSHCSTNVNLGSFPGSLTMPLDEFNSLPKDIQNLMIKQGNKNSIQSMKWFDQKTNEFITEFKKQDVMNMFEVSDSQLSQWQEAFTNVEDRWVNQVNSQGPAKEVLNRFKSHL